MNRRQITLICSGLLIAAEASASLSMPTIPSEGKSVADFVPAGWTIFKKAEGDLNSDKVKDYALILTKTGDNPEWGYNEKFSTSPRPLVVLHGSVNGKLSKVCVSPGAIMNGSLANDFALAAVDVKIANGNIVVTNGNGATSIENYESKYRLQNGAYYLIGFTQSGGRTDMGSFRTTDVNLNTGYTIVRSESGVNMKTGKAKQKETIRFYQLRAGLVPKAPATQAEKFEKSQWPGPTVSLNRKENVVLGSWTSPADLSAELSGVHTKDALYICARVKHKSANTNGFIRLVGPKQQIFEAEQCCTQLHDGKEWMIGEFKLANLKSASQQPRGRVTPNYSTLNLSVQVCESDDTFFQEAGRKEIISTSCDGEKHSGTIALTNSPTLPTLATWDWGKRDQ